jgi:hydroxymethylcytosylglucuronate/cytosylglucuronate synthase
MFSRQKFSLLAATRHIGWGGMGKLRLILEKLPCADVVLYGDEHEVAITKEFLGSCHKFDVPPPLQFDVALVINDPGVANSIAGLGVPVVYVDSLPHVHKTETDVPQLAELAYYCAQKYPIDLFPITSPLLATWQDITWIDPIVPVPQSWRGGSGIVINVGGLYAYNVVGLPGELANRAVDAYLNMVLFPLVELLQASRRKISAICGNLNAETRKRLRALVPDSVAVGPQPPEVFERILTESDLLISSPGSTTILQAMSIKLPTLLLPPQNRSQFLNARVYSKPGANIMRWPSGVIDDAKFEQLRSKGLSPLNSYIYKSMIEAAASQDLSDEVATIIAKAVHNPSNQGVLNPRLSALGLAGAHQVAQLVEQVAKRNPNTA